MFDTVGKTLDQDAVKRQFLSTLITGLLFLTIGAGVWLFFYLNPKAGDVIKDNISKIREIVIEDDATSQEIAPPPPPPPAAAARSNSDIEPTPTPKETDEVAKLDPNVNDAIKNDIPPAGSPNGVIGGEEGGQVGGVVGQHGTNVGGRPAEPVKVALADTRIKKQINPPYPQAAIAIYGKEQISCRVSAYVDAKGVPYRVMFKSCPSVFHETVEQSVLAWRWYPNRALDGNSMEVPLAFLFKPKS